MYLNLYLHFLFQIDDDEDETETEEDEKEEEEDVKTVHKCKYFVSNFLFSIIFFKDNQS